MQGWRALHTGEGVGRVTRALEMLIRLRKTRRRRHGSEPVPYLDRGNLTIPMDVPSRYRWWDERIAPAERLTVHTILVELNADAPLHRSYCGECPMGRPGSAPARDEAPSFRTAERYC